MIDFKAAAEAKRIVRDASRPNVSLDYVRPRPQGDINGVINPNKPETDPNRRTIVAHELQGAREIESLFRENPSTTVIISPSEMVFRADWQNRNQ